MGLVKEQLVSPDWYNTALVVVTYVPDERVVQQISEASKQFTYTIVADNSAEPRQMICEIGNERTEVLLNSSNEGLGNALNTACRRARELGYQWVVTLDQDTELYEGFLKNTLQAWSDSNLAVAILGCY